MMGHWWHARRARGDMGGMSGYTWGYFWQHWDVVLAGLDDLSEDD